MTRSKHLPRLVVDLPSPTADKLRAMKPGDAQVFRLGEKTEGHSSHRSQTMVSMFCSRSGMKVHTTIVVVVTTTPDFESVPALLVCCSVPATEKVKRGPRRKSTGRMGSTDRVAESFPGHTGEGLQGVTVD